MPSVNTKRLVDGMVLATEARTSNDEAVLPAGTVVSREAVRRLVVSQVARVEVTEESYGLAAMVDESLEGKTEVKADGDSTRRRAGETTQIQANLLRLAHMFNPHREDPVMRELLRLAIKCAQERLIRV